MTGPEAPAESEGKGEAGVGLRNDFGRKYLSSNEKDFKRARRACVGPVRVTS